MADQSRVYRARYVFPAGRAPIAGGIVAARGQRIEYVGEADGRAVDEEFPSAAITPGFVNAHTHLELGALRGKVAPPASFADWLREVVASRRTQTGAQLHQAVRDGVAASLRDGVTLLGDISTGGLSWSVLSGAAPAAVVFYEVIGMLPQRAQDAYEQLLSWLDRIEPTPRCRPAISPHAPYTVSASLYERLVRLADQRGLALATHWAETREELALLSGAGGPLRDFLREMGAWDDSCEAPGTVLSGKLPQQLTTSRTMLVHANYLDLDGDFPHTAHRTPHCRIAYCPRTHAYFGHAPHRFAAMLQRGLRVCIGTDSLASNPSLSVLEELRFLYREGLLRDGAALLRMGTAAGAEALGLADCTGSLARGHWADFAVVTLPDRGEQDPYCLLWESDLPVEATVCRGEFVYQRIGG